MKQQEKRKYFNLQQQTLKEIKGLESKPSLLMHVCCGVCASYVSLYLSEYFDLTFTTIMIIFTRNRSMIVALMNWSDLLMNTIKIIRQR